MKGISSLFWVGALLSPPVFAVEPVTMSGPVPPIEQISSTAFIGPETVIYTITNLVPMNLPLTVGGISGPVTRTPVADDCGDNLPAGPATCNIGIQITRGVGVAPVYQVLEIDYQSRVPLTSTISFNPVEPLLYVTPSFGSDSVLQFSIDENNGLFTSFETTYTNMSEAFGELTFATVNGQQYAYVANQGGLVYQCQINNDGTFSTCDATPQMPPAWNPRAIAFATVNSVQFGYVTDVGGGIIYQCSLNTNGTFSGCSSATATTFPAPYGITFASVNGTQYVYIADAGQGGMGDYGTVYQCPLNDDGTFQTCNPIPTMDVPQWIPYSVNFATTNGTQYAYVADNGTGSAGNVYQCGLNSDGSFTVDSCTPTPTSGVPVANWYPSDIAFATINGNQYAYVANAQGSVGGTIYRCTMNNDGTFNICELTPSTAPVTGWEPAGIAFRFDSNTP